MTMFSFSPTDIVSLTHIAVLGIVSLLGILLVARPLLGFVSRATAAAAASAPGATPALADGSNGGPAALAPPVPGQSQGQSGQAEPPSSGEGIDLDRVDGRVNASAMKKIGEIVEKHPDEAVSIIRNWMYQEAN